jgi:small-conductance mechanosensitive channel
LLKPDTVRLRDFIPSTAFLYLAVFGFMLALLAEMLDHQATHGQVWRVQVLGLRIVSWPLLLVSLGNILLDYSLGHWPAQTTKTVELVYAILWWLIPARLLSILVKQFLWDPLEQRAKRKVPDSVKSLTSFMIYLFATFGITAFVFNQAVTSLLATTGATAMIIGLAVKANIDNVFSGIVLNLERPFNIGDLVSYNKISGKIADITWRTTHITSDNGSLVIVPNSRISAGEINNFSRAPYFKSAVSVFVAPHHDPQKILSLIESCVPDNPHFLPAKPGQEPKVFYRGLQYDTSWTARYEVTIYTRDHKDQLKKAAQHLWLKLGQAFDAEGVVFEYETPREVSSSSNPELALEGQDA